MRRWKRASRWGVAVLAACLMAVAAGCGQLFSVSGDSGGSQQAQPTLQSLNQRVTQLEATVSELQASMAGTGGGVTTATTPSSPEAVVTASYLNVRQSPDANALKIGVLKNNTVVSVLSQSGGWTQIHYGPLTGWVESQWLSTPGSGGTGSSGSGTSAGGNSGSGSSSGSGGGGH
jgi:uncharacterized protein YraI